eukprot:2311581-Karenia_brevis.AAC.1
MGWRQGFTGGADDKKRCLIELGIPAESAAQLAWEIDNNGPILSQMGVDPKVVEIINSLHTGSWFALKGSQRFLVSRAGGRQGCKLGAIMFNIIYAAALNKVRAKLAEAGIGLHMKRRVGDAFWSSDGVDTSVNTSAE